MLRSSLEYLRCPGCGAESLWLEGRGPASEDIQKGSIRCKDCEAAYPILAGVAIVVADPGAYVIDHVKGISQLVADEDIPLEWRDEYVAAREELEGEHIEEDLEAERVNALYLMTHYLEASDLKDVSSPFIAKLIQDYWDEGPFAQIEKWVEKIGPGRSLIELGCGVGGLGARLAPRLGSYFGIDSSFASVALGRHLLLGAPYPREIRIPGDLLQGTVSKKVEIPAGQARGLQADLVVGDVSQFPLRYGLWDLTVALNTIDMLDEPADLPELQRELLKPSGVAIQSCPYVWHEKTARLLRERLPEAQNSSEAAERLYERAGFGVEERVEHLPWLFFKHLRQLEIYSVHAFLARRNK